MSTSHTRSTGLRRISRVPGNNIINTQTVQAYTHSIPDAAVDGVAGLLVSTGDAVELVGRLEGDGGGRDTRSPGSLDVHRMVVQNRFVRRRGLYQHLQLERIVD